MQRDGIEPGRVRSILEHHHSWIPDAYAIRVTDADGIVRWGTDYDPSARISLADRAFFQRLRDNPNLELVVGTPIVGRITKGWLVPIARRDTGPDGSFAGTVIVPVHVDYFFRLMSGLDLGRGGVAVLRDAESGLIARYPALDVPSGRVGAKGY